MQLEKKEDYISENMVTKDVEANTIVGGVPAKKISNFMNEETKMKNYDQINGLTTMTKLCFIGHADSCYVIEWANHFVERGWEVILISPTSPSEGDVLSDHVKFYKLSYNIKLNFPFVIYKINKILKQINPDIVHMHGVGVAVYSLSFLNIHPVILTEWGLDHIYESKGIRRFLEGISYKKADIITIGNKTALDILLCSYNINPDKTKIMQWGTKTNIFNINYEDRVIELRRKLKIDDNSFVVIYTRGMFEFWGYPYLVEAIPKVLKKNPSTVFVFIRGSGTDKTISDLRNKINNFGVEKNVIITDKRVPHNEMPLYLNMSDASVHLTPYDNESAALSESMACGSIIIASDHEYYRNRIKDRINGFLVKRDDPDQIADTINYCIEHPEVKEEIYKNNQKLLQTSENWEYNMKKMEEIYYELIERYKGRGYEYRRKG